METFQGRLQDRRNIVGRGRLAALTALAVVTAGAGASCKRSESTALVVEVRANGLQAGSDLDQVVATVNGAHPSLFSVVADTTPGTRVTFPFQFGVTPSHSADEQVTIEITGQLKGVAKIHSSARVGFVRGEQRLLVITLDAGCYGLTPACPSGQTCQGKAMCVSNQIDVTKLPPFSPGARADAGVDAPASMGDAAKPGDGAADGGGASTDASDAADTLVMRPEVLPDGATCFEGDRRACSCGAMAGGSQVCSASAWGACTISCAAGGLMGRCAAGTQTCDQVKMQWGDCSVAPAAADTCATGNDDSCNGLKNEGCKCLMGQTQTCDKGGLFGRCAAGTQTCGVAGTWSACTIAPLGADSCVANNDDNCNGKINEGCPCVQDATRPCSSGGLFGKCATGTQTCRQSVWSACSILPSGQDTCVPNNDDNCNGMKNEGCGCVMGQTRTCADGGLFGKCASGTETCDSSGHWGACNIAPASADSCASGDDSTCNGVVNEGCACIDGQSQLCSKSGSVGKCANGNQTCGGGKWGNCSISPSGGDTCEPNNDDNCNGKVNEGCPCLNGQSRLCSAGGLVGKCANGTQSCNSGAWSACSISPSGGDTCEPNNDDNCNGHTNDGCTCVHNVTRSCAADGKKGRCAGGTETCDGNGHWGACSISPAGSDVCNSTSNDDNCDGIAFEGCSCVSGTSRVCDGACGDRQNCNNGQWGACGDANTCSAGSTRGCNDCGGRQTCSTSTCTWGSCSPSNCCPVPINDRWSGYNLSSSSSPWFTAWPPPDADPTFVTFPFIEGGLDLPRDSIVQRSPGFPQSYVVSFSVFVADTFTFQVQMGDYGGNFPALRREGGPIIFGGLNYGRGESFGSFGNWSSQQAGGASVRITLYVKANQAQLAATSDFPALDSGLVGVGGFSADIIDLIGSNLAEYDGSLETALVSDLAGCAGLTDDQVDALYRNKKSY